MAVSATITTGGGSHYLSTQWDRGGKFVKEELYPVLSFAGVPRVGEVAGVQFRASRYTSSDGAWSDWSIYIHMIGSYSQGTPRGIGNVAKRIMRESGEPIIREWLSSAEYAISRRRVVAHQVARIIRDANSRHSIDNAREFLALVSDELSTFQHQKFGQALNGLERAEQLLAEATA